MSHPSVPAVLRRYGTRPKKALGQHFLINDSLAKRIVQAADLDEQSVVLEIGSGTGILTRHLLESAHHVVAVEIDPLLHEVLRQEFTGCRNLTLAHQNILDVDMAEVCRIHDVHDLVVIGNLPYNITGPVIEHLMRYRPVIRRAMLMTQEEVGRRLTACPGGKIYGALSVIVQYIYHVRPLFHVSAGNFLPRPAVESMLIMMTPHASPPVHVYDETLLYQLIRGAFQHRRKMLHHAITRISQGSSDVVASRTGIDLRRRGETLSLDEFARLTNVIWEIQDTGVPSKRA